MQSSIANIPIHQSEMQQVKRLKSKHCANNEKHEKIFDISTSKALKACIDNFKQFNSYSIPEMGKQFLLDKILCFLLY
jgi:dephospho-CoA kinase